MYWRRAGSSSYSRKRISKSYDFLAKERMSAMAINSIMVVGAGQMGSGIAQVAASAGIDVYLYDIEESFVQKGFKSINKFLERSVEKGKISLETKGDILNKIYPCTNLDEAKKVQLVIEAIVEDYNVKADVFKKLDEVCSNETIFASNTSSISITSLAKNVERRDKFIGMHFMNPVPLMKLVEIIKGLDTSHETYEAAKKIGEKMGKTCVEVQDFPGFVLNRILIPMINEAIYAVYEGIATVENVDTVMTLGANQPMGPLALADLVGLDTCLAIMEVLHEEFGDSKYRPCPLLKKYVNAGYLGKKSGRGFYQYQ